MRIASVLGILFFISSSRAQLENLLGLNLESIYGNVETIENAFGKTLTKKLIEAAYEVYTGTLTPRKALALLEELTSEEKDGAVQGIITLVQELEKIVSSPSTKDQLRMGFELAPMIMRQVISSTPEPTTTKKPDESEDDLEGETEPTEERQEVAVKLKQNETKSEQTADDVDTDEIRGLLGNLMGSGKVPDEFLEVMEQLLNFADEYEEADTLEERLALDDKTSKFSGIKDKLEARVDEIAQTAGEEKLNEDGIKEQGGAKEDNKKEHDLEKDEL